MPWERVSLTGVACFPFAGDTGEYQVPLSTGDSVNIDEASADGLWYKGTVLTTRSRGIFPQAFIHVDEEENAARAKAASDVATVEVTEEVHEWASLLKDFFLTLNRDGFATLRPLLQLLINYRRDLMVLMGSDVEDDELTALKRRIIGKIEEGRVALGLDIRPHNDNFEEASMETTPIVRINELYKASTGVGVKKSAVPGGVFDVRIHLDNLICGFGSDESAELRFFLYKAASDEILTDEFCMVLSPNDLRTGLQEVRVRSAVFRDIYKVDRDAGLHVVCRIFRHGLLVEGDKRQKNTDRFRRPYGVAVMEIPPDATDMDEVTVPLYQAATQNGFAELWATIIAGPPSSRKYQSVPRAIGVVLTCRVTSALDRDEGQDRAGGGAQAAGEARIIPKLTLPEVIVPGETRNDLYLTLLAGSFGSDGKICEVVVTVVRNAGRSYSDTYNDLIYPPYARDPVEEYESVVLVGESSPVWNETVRLVVPPDVIQDCHLRLCLRGTSRNEKRPKGEKAFGFAILRLFDQQQGAVVHEGEHTLPVFKYSFNKTLPTDQPGEYLLGPEAHPKAMRKDAVTVGIRLVSTVVTQNATLLRLIRWRENEGAIVELLNQFTFIGKQEIIKFFQDIFDAVFEMMDEKGDAVARLVFDAVVHVIGVLTDEKMMRSIVTGQEADFRPVLDHYCDELFGGLTTHRHFLDAIDFYLTNATRPELMKPLVTAFKSLEYVFKLILRSRARASAAASDPEATSSSSQAAQDTDEATFKDRVLRLFDLYEALLQSEDKVLLGAQSLACRHFAPVIDVLAGEFEPVTIADVLIRIVATVHQRDNKVLNKEKLFLVEQALKTELMHSAARRQVVSFVVDLLIHHLLRAINEDFAFLDAVTSILTRLLSTVDAEAGDGVWVLTKLIPSMTRVLAALPANHAVRTDLATCYLNIYFLMNEGLYERFFDQLGTHKKRLKYFTTTLAVLNDLGNVATPVYPSSWFTLTMMAITVSLEIVSTYYELMRSQFMGTNFAPEIWKLMVRILYNIVMSPQLQLEDFVQSKKNRIVSRFGDLRVKAVDMVQTVWADLGDHRRMQLYRLVAVPVLEMTLVDQARVRSVAFDMHFEMIEIDSRATGSIANMEVATINAFDRIAADRRTNRAFKNFYIQGLEERAHDHTSAKLRQQVETFIADMSLLIDLQLDLKNLPQGPEYQDDRAMATLKLMHYLKQVNRLETYVKYVYTLLEMHMESRNFTEAAFTLDLHYQLLAYSPDILPADERYPEEPSRARKVAIGMRIIELFERSKAWELAIRRMQEVAAHLRTVTYDYDALHRLLKRQAKLYNSIASEERVFNNYYRVAYYGRGFPDTLQGKEFVYRGYELEQMTEFQGRIKAKFPNAELLGNKEVSEDYINSDGQYIQLAKVEPIPDPGQLPVPADEAYGAAPANNIVAYYEHNRVSRFLHERPFKKEGVKKNKDNEFATLYLMETVMETEDTFPTIHHRSAIVRKEVTERPPIEVAVTALRGKNKELRLMCDKYSRPNCGPTSPFSMLLNGCILALVNGGVEKYKEVFFADEYREAHPEHAEFIDAIDDEIREQGLILKRALQVHKKIVSQEMMGLHNELEATFDRIGGDLFGIEP